MAPLYHHGPILLGTTTSMDRLKDNIDVRIGFRLGRGLVIYLYIYGRVRLDNVICLQRENGTKSLCLCVLQTGNHNTHSADKVRTFLWMVLTTFMEG